MTDRQQYSKGGEESVLEKIPKGIVIPAKASVTCGIGRNEDEGCFSVVGQFSNPQYPSE